MFPADELPLLDWITLQWPSPLMLLALASLVFAWRLTRATSRALSAAVAAMVIIHLLAWFAYGSRDSLHAVCSAIGLMLILPISLRSRVFSPLVVAACVLVGAVSLVCAGLGEPPAAQAARLIAGLANLAMLAALWTGLLASRNRSGPRAAVRQADSLAG